MSSGPVAFFVALFIVALGTIQLAATFHSYALNLSELNGLKRQEASLVAQKRDLENDISRWNDDAYVTAQARDRLGFVFPGEQAIRVEHPEAVTGVKPKPKDGDTAAESDQKPLPWYSELAYSFKKADKPLPKTAHPSSSAAATPSGNPTDGANGNSMDGASADTAGQQASTGQ